MDEYIKREDVKKVVCEGCNERFSEEPCEPPDCEILHAIKSVRAADVVPRAEYEQLQRKYELAVAEREANVKGFSEYIAKAKSEVAREVAREIFWGIDEAIEHTVFATCFCENAFRNKIAKLKKEFTKGGEADV